jgi:RNase adaptor protein for sRNA GlmZ degradation
MRLRLLSHDRSTPRRVTRSLVTAVGLALAVTLMGWTGHPVSTAVADPAAQSSLATTQTATATATPSSLGTITIETFGYSFGPAPKGCRFVADVRNIRAGSFSQKQTGYMLSVRKRVMKTPAAKKWHRIFLTKWLPQLQPGDMVAIGCARGHHRSVSLAIVFASDLRARGYVVVLVNRDIKKTW